MTALYSAPSKKENSSLGNNFITALHEDAEGNIWVGTDAGVTSTIPG